MEYPEANICSIVLCHFFGFLSLSSKMRKRGCSPTMNSYVNELWLAQLLYETNC
jgi:hypothetical protein